jgi:hypothetical protein
MRLFKVDRDSLFSLQLKMVATSGAATVAWAISHPSTVISPSFAWPLHTSTKPCCFQFSRMASTLTSSLVMLQLLTGHKKYIQKNLFFIDL